MLNKINCILSFSLLFSLLHLGFQSFAQTGGIRGYVRNDKGEPLPLASIYVKNTQVGTASNNDAYYELKLAEGKYQIVFQYLSYQTVEKEVVIGKEFINLDIRMELQTYLLREVEVKAGAEDPAYTIMRKAIAMSKVHKLQVDAYEARIYMKGTGRILNIPFLLEKKLKEEGIVEGKTYLTENITDLHFEQPNKYVKKVISLRSSDIEPKSASPMDYVEASFYDPSIADIVSPLSPSAFAYYKFSLESVFRDQGFEVNKIKVTPRSRGDGVWEGYIYIVENKWCIHSLQLETEKLGIKIGVQQNYSQVQDGVFMPITHQIRIYGKYLGFEAEGFYVASVSNYKLNVNPNFIPEVKLIDEKIEKEKAAAVNKQNKEKLKKGEQDLEEALKNGQELTRKNLKKLLKEAEKQQLENERKQTKKGETPPSELVRNASTTIDSLAYKRGTDEKFWEENRTIPLTDFEEKSYVERDSLVKVDSIKKTTEIKDSTGTEVKVKQAKKFQIGDLFFGGTYKTGKQSNLTLSSWITDINYNTVEGFASDLKLTYLRSLMLSKEKKRAGYLKISGLTRYSIAREMFTGKGEIDLMYNFRRKGRIQLDGGRYIQQMSIEYPIPMILNTLTTLVFERNWMKIYERDYVRLRWNDEVKKGLVLNASFEYANRNPLQNLADYRVFDWKERDFTSNNPENVEVTETAFPTHTAATFQANIEYKPFLQYGIKNGRKYLIDENSPILKFQYRKGMIGVDYDFLSLGIQHQTNVGIRGKVGYMIAGGAFLNKNTIYFPDFKHFNGNQIFVQFADPVSSFRLLDYYRFSTADKYLEGHAYIQFRKFLLTQFIYLRSFGWKENLFVNHLFTPKNNYTEVGYALDGILRLFRVEAIANFENGVYKNWGVRVGITTTFGLRVGMD
ncbi:MAG: DUF5686 and carboxypeptidase regulatory-like domain-containing protein [Thermoflexibacter sp.]